MKRILLLGGYGGFGGRIALRLAAAGHEVLVAGRSLARAQAFCAGRAGMRPLALRSPQGVAAALAAERPWALVDAAGPFQALGYDLPRAAAAAGCHYLDIADARDFVAGIGGLDAAAKAAGVAVISGASSLPALSGAAVRALAQGMDEVRAVEMAISASNQGSGGASVARAILSYAGRPVRLLRGGRWSETWGGQQPRRHDFAAAGAAPLAGRIVVDAEVPDLALLPERLPGRPAVRFRAGTERSLHVLGLWLLTWPVRWRWLRSLVPLAPLLIRGQRLTAGRSSDRSAMDVRLFGLAEGRRLERRWTIVADAGDGPEIPTLTVPILIERLARGEIAPGARDAGELLALRDYEPAFAALRVRHETAEIEQPPPLYARVMGPLYGELPPAVRAMHEVLRDGGACGRAVARRGANPLARVIGAAVGLPPAGEYDLHVRFEEEDGGVERWTRAFGRHVFHSRFSARGRLLVERFGPLRFGFALPADAQGLTMIMRRWWLGPLPLPLALAPPARAREWEEQGRFRFDVEVALPLLGLLVAYRGWLEPCVAAYSNSRKR